MTPGTAVLLTGADHDAWRDSYLYGKCDGSEGAAFAPREWPNPDFPFTLDLRRSG